MHKILNSEDSKKNLELGQKRNQNFMMYQNLMMLTGREQIDLTIAP